jgi:hypothetical protein
MKVRINETSLKKLITRAINETISKDMKNVTDLGDGEYDGIIVGHIFKYKDEEYWSKTGNKGNMPVKWTGTIKDGKQIR